MYKVIKYFTDLQDKNHPYNVGDIFPRADLEVSAERLAELSGKDNKQGEPLIAEVDEKEANLDKMTVEQLEAYAAEKNIDLTDCKNKAEKLAKIKEAEAAE